MDIKASVKFDKKLRDWDGFGVNYVQTCQTRDLDKDNQDYGGFSLLSEEDRARIAELTVGKDGLKPGLVKMFPIPSTMYRGSPGLRGSRSGWILRDTTIGEARSI
jgi:hypothetical protein